MGNYQDWSDLRDHLIEAFDGTVPTPQAEAEIINVYERHATATEKAALEIAAQYEAGSDIRSPWGLLHYKAGHIATAPRNPSGPSSIDREKRIQRAEQYVRVTGCHLHTEGELLDDLFGDYGRLHDYRDDEQLRDRMLQLWRERRPVSERMEAEALETAARTRQARTCPTCHQTWPFGCPTHKPERNPPSTNTSASENSETNTSSGPTTATELAADAATSLTRNTSSPSSTPSKSPNEPSHTSSRHGSPATSSPPSPVSPSTDPVPARHPDDLPL